MPEPSKELATIDPKVAQELRIITEGVETALGVRELTTDYKKRSEELTLAAFSFKLAPETDEDQAEVLAAQRAVAKLRTELTKNGDALKAPLNAARDKIIQLVKDGVATLQKAETHCQGLINHRQQKLLDARREAEAAAERERQRIAKEQEDAARVQEEAEKARKDAEEAAQRAEQAKGAEKAQADADAKRLAEEAQAKEDEAFRLSLEAEATPAPIVPVSELPTAKEVKDFTLNGKNEFEQRDNLLKLITAMPELFTAHIKDAPRSYTFTLKVGELCDRLNGKAPFTTPLQSAPGITITTKLSNLR